MSEPAEKERGRTGVAGIYPAYLGLLESDELEDRVVRARERMKDCVLCGRHCHVNRHETLKGSACGTGPRAAISSAGPHHGEEGPLRGRAGSGTIFFARCNLNCAYCQNWEISQKGVGSEVDGKELARIMLDLQARGCHNINLVSSSHVVAQSLEAIWIAARDGLRLPIVYNSGGYDSAEGLALMDGVVDIYMPDMKYGISRPGRHYSRVRNYTSVNRAAVKEMHRQVGDLVLDENGIARRGLLVRHLVLPGGLAGSAAVFRFLAKEISRDTYLNIMDQYHPSYRASNYPLLDHPTTAAEHRRAVALARKSGLHRFDRGHV